MGGKQTFFTSPAFVISVTPTHLKTRAAKQTGMQVPGPLTRTTCGATCQTIASACSCALRVVQIEVVYHWPTSRLRGISMSSHGLASRPEASASMYVCVCLLRVAAF